MPPTSADAKNPSETAAEKLLAFRVLALGQLLSRGMAVILDNQLGLSLRQWRVLFYLANSGPDSAQRIADFCRYDKSQVSRAVSELVEKKLVSTVADHEDGRRMVVSLTSAGMSAYRQGLPLSQARHEQLVQCLGERELRAFEATADKLTRQAQAMLDEAYAQTADSVAAQAKPRNQRGRASAAPPAKLRKPRPRA
jgi:DNA-binding MarR family transcriptional regulator